MDNEVLITAAFLGTGLLAIISSGKTIALMCAEKEPERCHRFILISPVLQSKGVIVIHIRPDDPFLKD
jgi:uncharacterized protein (DUF488 family)